MFRLAGRLIGPASFPGSIRNRVDERLIGLRMDALGDGEGLPVRLGLEGWRAHVGDPDLDRPQTLTAQSLAVRSHLVPRRLDLAPRGLFSYQCTHIRLRLQF